MLGENLWTNKYFIALAAIFACVLWGSAFPILKLTYAELQLTPAHQNSRLLLAGARFFLAALLLFAFWRFALQKSCGLERKLILPLLALGLAQTGLQYFFFYNGLAHTAGIKAAILNSASNFFVVLAAPFLYSEDRLTGGKILGLATGLGGILLVNWQPGQEGLAWDFSWRGEGFLLLSGLASVYGTFQAKKIAKKLHPLLINAYQLLFGSLALLLVAAPQARLQAVKLSPRFWGLLIYSAFLSAIAFSIWYSLLRYNHAGEVTLYRFTIPIAGAMLSALLLAEEHFTPSLFYALVLVAVGLAAMNLSSGEKTKRRGRLL